MKILFKLAIWTILFVLGGIAIIRFTYRCSWQDSFEIADQFVNDLVR